MSPLQTAQREVQQGVKKGVFFVKKGIVFLCGVFSGLCLVMLYLHRGLIAAAIKGEKLPEAPESCPAYKKK